MQDLKINKKGESVAKNNDKSINMSCNSKTLININKKEIIKTEGSRLFKE